MADLEIRNLHVRAADKDILKGLDLTVGKGEIHALMGPNGSGKSTLANVIMGQPNLEVTEGQIIFKGQDITEADPDERARMGLFMAFQYPVAIPGVTITKYLRMVMNAHRRERGEDEVTLKDFRKLVEQAMELTHVPREFSSRYLNEGFSGGEKKRLEILQLALQRPEIAVLDETDSGLDIDALNTVAHGVNTVASRDRPRRADHHPLPAHPAPRAARSRLDHVRGADRQAGRLGARRAARARGLRLGARRGRGGGVAMGALADTALALEFPSLDREGLVYLDSGATSQTPRAVLDAMDDYYSHHRGSVHRGVYPLAAEATELFEGARERVARFVNWGAAETIFTRNVTEALNLVAYAWGDANVGPGDRVVVTEMEHHSNFVPWQQLALRRGAELSVVGFDDDGHAGPRRARRAARRRRRQGRRGRARLQHAGDHQPGAGHRPPRARRRRHRRGRRRAGGAAAAGRPRGAGRRLLRLDRPQGLRAHRRRRPARARASCWPPCRRSSPAGT